MLRSTIVLLLALIALTSSAIHIPIGDTENVRKTNSRFCTACEWVVSFAEFVVTENSTVDEVMHYLDYDVCPKLITQVPLTVCREFVALYGPFVVNAVLTEETPQRVCSDLELCTNTTITTQRAATGFFWQISDTHLDPQYTAGSDPSQRCIKGTPKSGPGAGKFGTYVCDSPQITVEAVLQYMNTVHPNPDFLLWTGDSVPHYLDFTSVENYTAEMVLDGIQHTTNLLTKYFPKTRVFPSLGNHDNFLADQLRSPPEGSKWLTKIGQIWSSWLSADALKTFSYGGYYTELIEPGLRLISVNTIFCDSMNLWAALDPNTDIADQFKWLNQTLDAARQNKEKVYIIGHIPPGLDDGNHIPMMLQACNTQYLYMYDAYSDVILNNFFGHEHKDTFRLVRDLATNTIPVSSIFLTPSVTTFTEFNPSVRIYQYKHSDKELLNYFQYYANLTDANLTGNIKFQYSYDWKSAYGQPDFSPQSFLNLVSTLQKNDTMWKTYLKYTNNQAFTVDCSGDCWRQQSCALANIDYTRFTECAF